MPGTERGSAPSIWIDVEDLFDYFRFNPHPSGIQRVALQMMAALLAQAPPGRIRFARAGAGAGLAEVGWAEIEATVTALPAPDETREDAARPETVQRELAGLRRRQVIERLPPPLRDRLLRAGALQRGVGRSLRELLHAVRPPPPRAIRAVPGDTAERAESGGAGPEVGDLYLALGAPWSVPGAAEVMEHLHARGVRTALLIHDLIPLRRPEWQEAERVARFRSWFERSLAACELVLTISRTTAADVTAYAAERGLALARPVRTLPAGDFAAPAAATRPAGLPAPGRYVLFVSTLEARKNHRLALRVWHKLLEEVRSGQRAPESVPELVFAGRVGTGVADVLQQLENSRWLSGRVRLIRDPTDAEVRALYEGCLFTLLPSLAEGWGLPVRESLALGKPCLAAGGEALREAGGSLCRYFDPEDAGDAHRAVAAALDEPGGIAAWTEQVRREFRHRDWSGAADALLAELEPVPA